MTFHDIAAHSPGAPLESPSPWGRSQGRGCLAAREAGFEACGNVSGPLPLTPSPKGRGTTGPEAQNLAGVGET